MPHIKTGRMRALAITSTTRSDLLPEVPTMAEAGLPGYEFTQWYGLLAPGKTPREIVNALHSTLLKAMHDAEVKRRVAVEGGAFAPGRPEEFSTFLKAELDKNARMIREAGLKRE